MMRSPAFPPRRPSHFVRYIVPAGVLLCLLYYLSHTGARSPAPLLSPGSGAVSHGDAQIPPLQPADDKKPTEKVESEKPILGPHTHPIDKLIKDAETNFYDTLGKQSNTLEAAAAAYRKRRGRHPPPGFREWYEFAKEHKAVMVEDFWDQIYHDLGPFWGLDPKIMRKESWDFEMTINIRNRNASAGSDWFWTEIWLSLIKTIETYLPDMDIALNAMDEPRLVVPWEDIKGYMEKGKGSQYLWPANQVVTEYDTLPDPKTGYKTPATRKPNWEKTGT
jgi:hypothetical protein